MKITKIDKSAVDIIKYKLQQKLFIRRSPQEQPCTYDSIAFATDQDL